jgi:hypothetical protein
MKTQKALLILAAVVAGTNVYADKVTLTQAPPAVQQAIRSRSGRHTVEDIDRDTKNGQTTYEASWKDQKGVQQELLVSDSGQILRDVNSPAGRRRFPGATSGTSSNPSANVTADLSGFTGGQQAPMNWASETAQNKLRSLAGGASIDSFQKGQYQGKTAYEASYKANGTATTVIVDESGNLLAQSPAATSTASVTTAPVTTQSGSIAGFSNAQAAPMNWASETVQNKFKQMANGAAISNFQKGQFNGRTAYAGTYSQNGQSTTLVLGEDGSVLSSSPTATGAPATSATGTLTK